MADKPDQVVVGVAAADLVVGGEVEPGADDDGVLAGQGEVDQVQQGGVDGADDGQGEPGMSARLPAKSSEGSVTRSSSRVDETENHSYIMLVMTTYCQVTGARPVFGRSVSHSHKRTPRRWDPNLQRKRYWVPSLGRTVRLTVSAKGIRTIDKLGIDVVVAQMLARGEKLS